MDNRQTFNEILIKRTKMKVYPFASEQKIVFIENIDGKVADYFYVHEKFLEKIGKIDNINTEEYWDIVEPWGYYKGPKKLVWLAGKKFLNLIGD